MDKVRRKVVSPESAMKLLRCSRFTFYKKFVPQLTRLPKQGKNTYFDMDEVLKFSTAVSQQEESFEIVKI